MIYLSGNLYYHYYSEAFAYTRLEQGTHGYLAMHGLTFYSCSLWLIQIMTKVKQRNMIKNSNKKSKHIREKYSLGFIYVILYLCNFTTITFLKHITYAVFVKIRSYLDSKYPKMSKEFYSLILYCHHTCINF